MRMLPLSLSLLGLRSAGVLAAALIAAGATGASAQAPAPDSVVYQVAPSSVFEVRTGKAGVFGFAGHSHVIRARSFSGWVRYAPSNPVASRLQVIIPTKSLEVLTPPDTAERRKVTANMRTKVLRVADYPEIRFTATAAKRTSNGFHLNGQLTLVGQTRPVPVDVTVDVGADTVRARGKFAVNQSDFGIKPLGGAVKVANRVTFDFDVVAVRAPARRPRA